MHRCQLFCHNQGIYLDEYIQATKHFHLCAKLAAELEPGTFDFLMQVANYKVGRSIEFALYTLALVAVLLGEC